MSYFLSIKNNRIEISRSHRDAFPYIVTSVADFHDYMEHEASRVGAKIEELEVMASSSMDFPEEFTNDPATIALARELRPLDV